MRKRYTLELPQKFELPESDFKLHGEGVIYAWDVVCNIPVMGSHYWKIGRAPVLLEEGPSWGYFMWREGNMLPIDGNVCYEHTTNRRSQEEMLQLMEEWLSDNYPGLKLSFGPNALQTFRIDILDFQEQ